MMRLDQIELPFTIRPAAEKWEVLMSLFGEQMPVLCETRQDADEVADAGPLLELSRTGGRCSVERVRNCIHALARCGYQMHTSLLARMLGHFEEKMASEAEEWA
jgi:hypothetical protein